MWVPKVAVLAALCLGARGGTTELTAMQQAYLHNSCDTTLSASCVKLNVISWLDNAETQQSYEVVPGVTLVRDEFEPKSEVTGRSLSDDNLDSYLYTRVARFVKTHSFKLQNEEEESNDVGTARRKSGGGGGGGGGGKGGKKGGGMMDKLAMLAIIKAALLGFFLKLTGLIAFKALIIGKIALLIAGGIAIKSLMSSKGGSGGGGHGGGWSSGGGGGGGHGGGWSSGGDPHGGGGGGGWGRAYDEDLPKGLQSDYKPPQ